MTFDPLEWIDLADQMGRNPEAARRAAIGRYYYAVFLKSLLSLDHDGRLERRGDRSDHSAVVRELRLTRRRAGSALYNLQRLRELADYDEAAEIATLDVERARTLAAEVVLMCRSDWARLP